MDKIITLMTYNVHEAVGRDKKKNYMRIIEVIKEIDPDIITMQEVDSIAGEPSDQLSFLFEMMTDLLPYTGTRGVTLFRARSAYGNATFSRVKPKQVLRHDISFDNREPRGVLECRLSINKMEWRVLNTHLGLKKKERRQQINSLLPLLKKDTQVATILSGDFNEWHFKSRRIRLLEESLQFVPKSKTFPARFPFFALDRIFFNRQLHLVESYVHRSALSRTASDHRPLVARFRLKP